MANRKGLGISKKYAKGTIHETASGRFVVLDRFAEEDDDKNIPILEFQWLTGEKEGQIETNREMNMAANIHKFLSSRGRQTAAVEPKTIEDEISFVEKIDKTFEIVNSLTEHLEKDEDKMIKINQTLEIVDGIKDYIDKAAATVIKSNSLANDKMEMLIEVILTGKEEMKKACDTIGQLENIITQQQFAINQLTEQVNLLITHNTVISKQQENLSMQQAVVNKLIEKL